jgi:hypothetical protein
MLPGDVDLFFFYSTGGCGRVGLRRGGGLRRIPERPVSGFKSIFSQVIARLSYSRRPHKSQTQAGKFGTVINSSFSHVK